VDISAPEDAARLLQLRRAARNSLEAYASYIEVPDRPVGDEDAEEFSVFEGGLALHHTVMCRAIQRCVEKRHGRLMIMAPPGAAKSTYTSVVAPTWIMGRWPGRRIILASYGSELAEKQSKKARSICRTRRFQTLFNTSIPNDQRAADEWALNNGSAFMCGGILSGLTGNRGNVVFADDLLKGRNEAESDTIRTRTWEAYRDDLRSRLVSGGSLILMNTRWHQQDISGMILPADWAGESGIFLGSDGLEWEVISLPAKVETPLQERTDPLGRKIGQYLWPDYWDLAHWQQSDPALGARDTNTPTGRRAWYSMYQQIPHPDDGILFKREDFRWYEKGELPTRLRTYIAGDWALTDELLKPDPDYTEIGVAGLDDGKNEAGAPALWLLDWYTARKDSETTVPAFVRLLKKWRSKVRMYFGEQGNIETLVGPMVKRECRDRKVPELTRKMLPTAGAGNKVAKASAFKKLVEEGRVYLPVGAYWADRLVDQCCAFPGGSHDDMVDVGSLFGRAMDVMVNAQGAAREEEREARLTPFTYEWHERTLQDELRAKAERGVYFE
jgi:predicted phage terminase large subunit-like protein